MNTVTAVLRNFSQKDSEGRYAEIFVILKSGKEFRGSLASWDQGSSPNLVIITGDKAKAYIDIASIEAVVRPTYNDS